MSVPLKGILGKVVKTSNFIKSRPLNTNGFNVLCENWAVQVEYFCWALRHNGCLEEMPCVIV